MVNRRGVIAAVLGFVYPGLGHVYLRRWVRAVSWFVLALVTAALVVPESAYQAFQTDGFAGLVEASESFGLEVTLSLLVIRVLNVVDAYLVAVRDTANEVAERVPTPGGADADAAGEPVECPECGKELDSDLDFCPWCTTRFDTATDDAESA
ncbi:zinc ribbon domain-containing protein [Halobacterium sp. KA-6]|uniref:zinc ribbon domain-containing protein n=1 Tax=Halobacterium sp. KA-6 TaxID=2896368 RepID=UPI001E3814EB|nr:zinc ribbon domain-containing protein [Halobacterium sp. KA-6]MCD2202011.1 zinc ribbon domain-containing protein [Halobacterium sp. KA-6]